MKISSGFLIICILPFIAACSILTKSQMESINTYSGLLEKYSDYPSSIVNEYIQIKYDVEQLNTGTFGDTLVNSKLWESIEGRERALEEASNIDLGMKVIGEYASALKRLSSKELSAISDAGAKKFGSDIDQLIELYNSKSETKIPSGIGGLVNSVYSLIGTSFIKNRQARDLKAFVEEGQKFIPLLTEAMKNDLTKVVIERWLPPLKADIKNRQENLLRNIPTSNYKVYLANLFNKEVAQLIVRYDHLEQMTKRTINSIETVGKVHKQILDNIQKRKKMEDFLPEIQAFYVTVTEISSGFQSIIRE